VTPPEAERVPGRVGVDLVPLAGGEIVGGVQQSGTERHGLGVGRHRVVDVQIEVDLLRVPVRPFGRDVVGGELDADHPPIPWVDHAVPVVFGDHAPTEQARPERALGPEVRGIEHDHRSPDVHGAIIADESATACAVLTPAREGTR
jgi:hypothetical protein